MTQDELNKKFAEGLLYELDKAGMDKEAIFQWLAGMAKRLKTPSPQASSMPKSLLQVGVQKQKLQARLNAAKPEATRTEPPKAVAHPEPEDIWGQGSHSEARTMVRLEARRTKPGPAGPKPEWKPI